MIARAAVRLGGCLALLLMLLAAMPPAVAQSERILSFDAQVTVRPDGVLRVVETIEVIAAGRQIQRGIFRDFPTRGITGLGFNHRVDFRVVAVERNGRPEPWFSKPLNIGVRVYFGDPDVLLEHGRHRYALTYETSPQLLHRSGEDELYWNVTGNDWAFPIDRASATVRLPPGAAATAVAGYTGPRGWQGADFEILRRDGGTVQLATTRTLAPGEGFTIAVAWPEGTVTRPRPGDQRLAFIAANRGTLAGYVLTVVLLAYFVVAWHRVGRDPPKGTVIPLFEAPDGLSPVATGYIWNQGFRGGFAASRALAVAISSLATRRLVGIEDEGDGEYLVERLGRRQRGLPPGEAAVLKALFQDDGDAIRFGGGYEPRLGAALTGLVSAIGREYGQAYFRRNRDLWAGGVVIGAVAALCSLIGDVDGGDDMLTVGALTLFALAFGGVGLVFLGMGLARLFGLVARRHWLEPVILIGGSSLGLLPAVAMLALVSDFAAPASLGPAILPALIAVVFWHLLTAPTNLGRKTLDAIEGYRLYLSVAEAGRLDAAGREPEVTAALFERHLPYAMALGVETEWSDKVLHRLTASLGDPDKARQAMQPGWFRMSGGGSIGSAGIAGSLAGGLAGAAAASSSPPSSGGSSGGGSSGGGGGGGGGGGW